MRDGEQACGRVVDASGWCIFMEELWKKWGSSPLRALKASRRILTLMQLEASDSHGGPV